MSQRSSGAPRSPSLAHRRVQIFGSAGGYPIFGSCLAGRFAASIDAHDQCRAPTLCDYSECVVSLLNLRARHGGRGTIFGPRGQVSARVRNHGTSARGAVMLPARSAKGALCRGTSPRRPRSRVRLGGLRRSSRVRRARGLAGTNVRRARGEPMPIARARSAPRSLFAGSDGVNQRCRAWFVGRAVIHAHGIERRRIGVRWRGVERPPRSWRRRGLVRWRGWTTSAGVGVGSEIAYTFATPMRPENIGGPTTRSARCSGRT